jgi:hypothetical protein
VHALVSTTTTNNNTTTTSSSTTFDHAARMRLVTSRCAAAPAVHAGAYEPASDMVLILDVARFKYPAHWVSLPDLYKVRIMFLSFCLFLLRATVQPASARHALHACMHACLHACLSSQPRNN